MSEHAEPFDREPWFLESLRHARIRRGARVLLLTAHSPSQAVSILEGIGEDGVLTVIEPDPARAQAVQALDHPNLVALGIEPDGSENLGPHDAVVSCPAVAPEWPMNRWGQLAVTHLRPGGRLVLDLPGARHCDALRDAWEEIGADPVLMREWNGPPDTSLARLLRADGLRNVEPSVTTHLVKFETPYEAAAHAGALLGAHADVVASLHLALARRFETGAELELLFRRTRVLGMR